MEHFLNFPTTTNVRKLAKQQRLLDEAVNKHKPLADILLREGWTYDDLQYSTRERLSVPRPLYFTLDDFRQKEHEIPVVSFFSGAGGLDLGFEAAGFSHQALVEHKELFCETLRRNRPEWRVIGPPQTPGDVSEHEDLTTCLQEVIGRSKRGFDGVFVGGPPCQPFSIAANQRFSKSGDNFKRIGFAHEEHGNLLFDFISLIKAFRPAAFLIENVTGLLDVDGGDQLREAYRDLGAAGYKVHKPVILNAANFKVPQSRIRLFIVGSRRNGEFRAPVGDDVQLSCAGAFMRTASLYPNHVGREHSAESILRYMRLTFGARDQLGRVDRLDPRLPSKTVIAGGTSGGGRSHLHPTIPRTLTVRESAILQTFPDDYVFEGPAARQFTQVGNAVPPVLGCQLALALKRSIFC